MILARLLSPADYGVVAMVAAITGFVAVLKDGGLSTATIQQTEITDAQVSTLFWINASLGFSVAAIVLMISPAVAWFYNNPDLMWVTCAMSVPFALGGLTVQHQALLQRQMRFRALAAIDISCMFLSLFVAVIMAIYGFHYWSLVTMTITSALANVLLVWVLCRWRPTRPRRGSGVRSMLAFGGGLTINNLLGTVGGAVDRVLLGKFFGTNTAGQYSRAQGLLYQPIQQIMPALQTVGLPALSRLKSQPEKYSSTFLNLMKVTVFASSFMAAFIFSGADWLVKFFLGPQWTEAVAVFRCFVGPVFTIPISTLCILSLTAQGKGLALVRWGIVNNAVVVFSILMGLPWGAKGVAAAISISSVCVRVPYLYYLLGKVGPVAMVDLWRIAAPGFLLCITATFALLLLRSVVLLHNVVIGLLILFCMNAVLHGLVAWGTPWGKSAINVVRSLVLSLKTGIKKVTIQDIK